MREEEDPSYDDEGLSDDGLPDDEGFSQEEDLLELPDADLSEEEPSDAEREAVDLPEFLRQALILCSDAKGQPFPEGHRSYGAFKDQKPWDAYRQTIKEFCNELLDAMHELPPSPGRRKLSAEQERALRSEFRPVARSFIAAKALLALGCNAAAARTGKRVCASSMISTYVSDYDPYTKYKALDSWLWRRTGAYQKWAASYYRRPEVRARKAKNRPGKDAEAVRKRNAYYAAKGILEPPPKRMKSSMIVAVREAAEVKGIDEPAFELQRQVAQAPAETSEPTPAQTAASEAHTSPISVSGAMLEPGAPEHPNVAPALPDLSAEVFANL